MKAAAVLAGSLLALGGPPVVTRVDCSHPVAVDVPLGWRGGEVAFRRMRATGPQKLLLARPAAPGLVRLRVPHVGFTADWSRDGRSLSVTWGTFFKTTDVLERNGSLRFRLGQATAAAWSPDGRTLAYVRAFRFGRPPDAVHLVDADGADDRTLADGERPSWSPDGRRLAFSDGSRIRTIGADGRKRRLVAAPERPVNGLIFADPRWSPRGEEIAFRAQRGAVSELLAVHPDGSGERRITAADVQDFRWSPDGRRLAVELLHRVGVVAVRGGRVRLLRGDGGRTFFPRWSPDGRWLAYAAASRNRSEVWLADARTLRAHRLTSHCEVVKRR